MTEGEAKTKWCPFVRAKFASTSDAPSCNREMGPQTVENVNPWLLAGSRCIASACMAWRNTGVITVPHLDGEPLPEGALIHPAGRPVEHRPTRTGYCGLAGAPQ